MGWDGASTASLYWDLITLTVSSFFPICNLNWPSGTLKPFPLFYPYISKSTLGYFLSLQVSFSFNASTLTSFYYYPVPELLTDEECKIYLHNQSWNFAKFSHREGSVLELSIHFNSYVHPIREPFGSPVLNLTKLKSIENSFQLVKQLLQSIPFSSQFLSSINHQSKTFRTNKTVFSYLDFIVLRLVCKPFLKLF